GLFVAGWFVLDDLSPAIALFKPCKNLLASSVTPGIALPTSRVRPMADRPSRPAITLASVLASGCPIVPAIFTNDGSCTYSASDGVSGASKFAFSATARRNAKFTGKLFRGEFVTTGA